MFKRREEIKALESEVEFLRSMVKDLTDRLMALTGEPHARFHSEKRTEEAIKEQTTTEQAVFSKIDGMKAMNEDERQQKEAAMDFASAIIGGGSHAG